jgi:acid phosphatase (class A)
MKQFLSVLLLVLFLQQASAQSNTAFPQAWGQYKKLALYNTQPQAAFISWDSRTFDLSPNETKVPSLDFTGKIIANGRERNPFYLSASETFTVPAPPANSSLQTRAELDYLLQLQQQRSKEDERASAFYAGVYYRTAVKPADADYIQMRRNLFHIGRSIGTWFNADSLPLTAMLAANVWKDAEYLIWKYKNYFIRIRPYKLEPALKNLEETNWAAYPSGHATNSYVNAFLFSALIPEFEGFFMKDAYDMAHSREIIGVHYPSDSESGRNLAYQLIERLMKNKEFQKDYAAALAEINQVKQTKGF